MKVDEEGFWYPLIDSSECINCGICEKTCPIINEQTSENTSEKAFAVINKDEQTRNKSSSGGVFTLLAEKILDCGGVVFGAAFTEDFKAVEHIAIHDKEQLPRLMGSKYLQSSIGDAYLQAKNYLQEGRMVLFSGTPCQIAGLYAYLGNNYENLITQDIICHGVPSPKIWEKYVEYRENKSSSKTETVSFRHKSSGWQKYSMQFSFQNGKEYIQNCSTDLYMQGFLRNIYLRPSCYKCSFKYVDRISDITLADFWGIENVIPEMYDNKGTSLILVNSKKGTELFKGIRAKTKFCEVDKRLALKYNSAATKCPEIPQKRNVFMVDLQSINFEKLLKKYCREKLIVRIKILIKRLLKIVGGKNGV